MKTNKKIKILKKKKYTPSIIHKKYLLKVYALLNKNIFI